MGLPAVKTAVAQLARASLPDAKTLRDKAQAIERYHAQAKSAQDLEQQAGEIRIRAERRIGELLRTTIKRGNPQWSSGATNGLKALGITKNQSSRWQMLASVPEAVFEREIEKGQTTVKHYVKLAWMARLRRQRKGPAAGGNVYACDLADLPIDDGSVDLLLTDPPYAELPVYGRLAEFAARKLKPGKLCLAYCSTHKLPQVLGAMGEHLTYHWLYVVAGQSATLHRFNVHAKSKLVVAFSNGKAAPHGYLEDLVAGGGREKTLHIWQQSETEATHFIDKLSMPGELIVDPFCGSGTVLSAAKTLGRRWIGGDVDAGACRMSRRRVA